MAQNLELRRPWLVAAWPGMGHVALNAGVYLLAKLKMSLLAEFDPSGLFDVDAVEVKQGVVQPVRRPRNRLFLWSDPQAQRDLVVFLGEAQPPMGKYAFCRQLIDHGRKLGVERVFTFAAMATQMRSDEPCRVFGAATSAQVVEELKRLDVQPLDDGRIGGLNGVLLGAAAEEGLAGACLLGEMPHIFSQLAFPRASLAILETFITATGIELDLTALADQARETERQLGELLAQVEETYGREFSEEEEEEFPSPPAEEERRLSPSEVQRIETLFDQAAEDRAKAFDLKQELDRLGVFKEYEDRFLDLFKKPG